MNIGGREIRSQGEYPHDFHPDWRNRVAMAVVETKVRPRGVRLDTHVRDQISYLERKARDGFDAWKSNALTRAAPDARALLLANDIYEQSTTGAVRPRIEALLMCDEHVYKGVADMYGLSTAAVSKYEKLFFNVRDRFGKVVAGTGRRSKLALGDLAALDTPSNFPTYWRLLAFEGRAALLAAIWGWPVEKPLTEVERAEHIMNLLTRSMDARIRGGFLDGKSAAGLLSDMTEILRNARRDGALGSGELTEESLALRILMMCGMTVARPEGARKSSLDEQLKSKLAAAEQTSASPMSRQDTLKSVNAFVEMQRASIS